MLATVQTNRKRGVYIFSAPGTRLVQQAPDHHPLFQRNRGTVLSNLKFALIATAENAAVLLAS